MRASAREKRKHECESELHAVQVPSAACEAPAVQEVGAHPSPGLLLARQAVSIRTATRESVCGVGYCVRGARLPTKCPYPPPCAAPQACTHREQGGVDKNSVLRSASEALLVSGREGNHGASPPQAARRRRERACPRPLLSVGRGAQQGARGCVAAGCPPGWTPSLIGRSQGGGGGVQPPLPPCHSRTHGERRPPPQNLPSPPPILRQGPGRQRSRPTRLATSHSNAMARGGGDREESAPRRSG